MWSKISKNASRFKRHTYVDLSKNKTSSCMYVCACVCVRACVRSPSKFCASRCQPALCPCACAMSDCKRAKTGSILPNACCRICKGIRKQKPTKTNNNKQIKQNWIETNTRTLSHVLENGQPTGTWIQTVLVKFVNLFFGFLKDIYQNIWTNGVQLETVAWR